MGWAKYYEDNMEICYDRMQMKEHNDYINTSRHKEIAEEDIVWVILSPAIEGLNSEEMQDKNLFCKECGRLFIFSVSAQKKFAKYGWKEPKRCKRCRELREVRSLMRASY